MSSDAIVARPEGSRNSGGGEAQSFWHALSLKYWSSRHPAAAFVGRRLIAGVVTLLLLSVLIFLATTALPGNVAQVVLGRNASPARVAALERLLNINHPLPVRYVTWLWGLLQGNLGKSAVALAESAPQAHVSALIGSPLLNSLILGSCAAVLLVPLSIAVGVYSATRRGRAGDSIVSYGTIVFGSLPEFVLGTFLILILSLKLNLLPPIDSLAPGQSPFSEPRALILPVLTLLGVTLAFTARQIRASMVGVLNEDHVKMARLNGIAEWRVRLRYGLRTAVAPSIQSFAQAFQYLFGGIIVVENVYDYPGIGTTLVQIVQERDLTEIQGVTIVLAAAYVLINIAADLLVVLLVPKLRTSLGK
jgi:peptide/nickel transport system permease protein